MRRLIGRQLGWFAVLVFFAAIVCVGRVLIYREPMGGLEFAWPEAGVARFRLTPLIIGAIVGVSLATSGVMLQALLRNPLAEPFILGLSTGAGLGVMIATYVAQKGEAGRFPTDAETIPAMLGALATLAVVYVLGQRRGWLDPVSLVLVGVIISTICGAGIMFFQHLVPTGLRGEFTLWLMGHVPDAMNRWSLILGGTVAAIGLTLGILMGRAMDAATLGDEEARSVGLAIGPMRLGMFILAGILAAQTVALAGPIGFVGLIAPHAARLLLGPRHTPLVIGAALAGIVLVVGSDVARQAIDFGGGRMPIGIFTALIGGPAFIWLLLSGKGQT